MSKVNLPLTSQDIENLDIALNDAVTRGLLPANPIKDLDYKDGGVQGDAYLALAVARFVLMSILDRIAEILEKGPPATDAPKEVIETIEDLRFLVERVRFAQDLAMALPRSGRMERVLIELHLVQSALYQQDHLAQHALESGETAKAVKIVSKAVKKAYKDAGHRLGRLRAEIGIQEMTRELRSETQRIETELYLLESAQLAAAETEGGPPGQNRFVGTELLGEWSKPMSKTRMMQALGIDSRRAFSAWLKDKELRNAGNRQTWVIRLDTLDQRAKAKLEKA